MTSDSSPPVLPGELSDKIIDFLADDWRALAVCALVCSAWRARAGYHLSRGVILTPTTQAYQRDIIDFMRIFVPGSPICDYITALTIGQEWKPTRSNLGMYLPVDDLDFGPFRNLRSLTLTHLSISSEVRFRELYTSAQVLEELTVYDVYLSPESEEVNVTSRSRQGNPCPPLRLLRIGYSLPQGRVSDTIRDDLRLAPVGTTLHTLHLHLPTAEGWQETLACLQLSLRNLRIHVWPRRTVQRVVWEPPELYTAIAGCRYLRRLTLHVSPGSQYPSAEFPALCNSIAQWLAPPACLFAATLEKFTLCLCIRLKDLAPRSIETVAVVGRALRREAFPSLTHVRISIHDGFSALLRSPSFESRYKKKERMYLDELTAALREAQGDTAQVDVGIPSTIVMRDVAPCLPSSYAT
ncbi:hypothetical protein OH77DRAFT_1525573 [Trametes cingulata]|nr:hypothetical protein OH77DRAFT_1525573 [Trametes cingulata]